MANDKPAAPGKAPRSPSTAERKITPPPRPSDDQRWQRSVRFNWDKGGSRGGRK